MCVGDEMFHRRLSENLRGKEKRSCKALRTIFLLFMADLSGGELNDYFLILNALFTEKKATTKN